jgi:hypothetical protein
LQAFTEGTVNISNFQFGIFPKSAVSSEQVGGLPLICSGKALPLVDSGPVSASHYKEMLPNNAVHWQEVCS